MNVDWRKVIAQLDVETMDAMSHTAALKKSGQPARAAVMYGNTLMLSALARALVAGLETGPLPELQIKGPTEPVPKGPDESSGPSEPNSSPTPYTPFQR